MQRPMESALTEVRLPIPEKLVGWGMHQHCYSPVFRPQTEDEIIQAFQFASNKGLPACIRGAGRSYGDASLNTDGILIETLSYNKIRAWDENRGVVCAQSGIQMQQLAGFALEKGYWLPVAPESMSMTLGGVMAMNLGGKNLHIAGNIGEHIWEFDLLTPMGKVFRCSREENVELFYAAISGLGFFGIFLEVKLILRKVHMGDLQVANLQKKNLEVMIDAMEELAPQTDYMSAWIDTFAHGESLGRGVLSIASYFAKDRVRNLKTFSPNRQRLASRTFGIVPNRLLWFFLYPFANETGVRLWNYMKYHFSAQIAKGKQESCSRFCFSLDTIPNLRNIYKPGSSIRYQAVLPKRNAFKGITEILKTCQRQEQVVYFAKLSKHKKDTFLLSAAPEGYMISLDIPIVPETLARWEDTNHEIDEIVLQNSGKIFFANDTILRPELVKRILGNSVLKSLRKTKDLCDPQQILQSDLYRRLFGDI